MAEAHIRIWNLENLAVTSQFGHGLLGVSVLKVEFSITVSGRFVLSYEANLNFFQFSHND